MKILIGIILISSLSSAINASDHVPPNTGSFKFGGSEYAKMIQIINGKWKNEKFRIDIDKNGYFKYYPDPTTADSYFPGILMITTDFKTPTMTVTGLIIAPKHESHMGTLDFIISDKDGTWGMVDPENYSAAIINGTLNIMEPNANILNDTFKMVSLEK